VAAIGLHSRDVIADDQFTASSSWLSQYPPSAARINHETGLLDPSALIKNSEISI